jgi:protein gp37
MEGESVKYPLQKADPIGSAKNKQGIKQMEYSKIEWCDHTVNPWIGCQKVSPGCDHCYAEAQNAFRKWNGGTWGPHAPRKRTSVAYWKQPLKWNREAVAFEQKHGHRPRGFCASLADVFDNQVPSAWREDLFELIRKCDQLDWLLLTKRPQNILKMLPSDLGDGDPNVWLGITAEDQVHFDQRWKLLQKIPASLKFISYEPALGALRLPALGPYPDWLISGRESGGGARPVKRRWIRDVIADCREHGVAPFHKQWGSYQNNPLVVNKGMSVKEAKGLDAFGKGGGLVDDKLVREFPVRRNAANRDAA